MLGWKVEYLAAMVVAQGSRYVPERGVTEPVGHMSRAAHGIQKWDVITVWYLRTEPMGRRLWEEVVRYARGLGRISQIREETS